MPPGRMRLTPLWPPSSRFSRSLCSCVMCGMVVNGGLRTLPTYGKKTIHLRSAEHFNGSPLQYQSEVPSPSMMASDGLYSIYIKQGSRKG